MICAYMDAKASILVISKLCDIITALKQKLENIKFHLLKSRVHGSLNNRQQLLHNSSYSITISPSKWYKTHTGQKEKF